MKMRWVRHATGGWVSADANATWHVRPAPSFRKAWFWLYGPRERAGAAAPRYTPTGRFADCVGFGTAREAKAYAERLSNGGA